MEELKEIKSVTIVPFTLMSSAISAVLGLIYALILIVTFGVVAIFVPSITSSIVGILLTSAVAIILVLPVSSFLMSIMSSFLLAFLYNLLVPRIGGIKLGMHDMKELRSLEVISISLMLSALYTIFTFIIMLIMAPILMLILQGAALSAISTSTMPELGGIGALGIIGIIVMVIGIPILVFISTFIYSAIMALLYNFLAPKIGGVRLKFTSVKDNILEIKKIKPIPLALILAVVSTILNFLFSIPQIIMYFAVGEPLFAIGYFLGNTAGTFIAVFIIYSITALIYNFLRPTIGGVELELD